MDIACMGIVELTKTHTAATEAVTITISVTFSPAYRCTVFVERAWSSELGALNLTASRLCYLHRNISG